MYTATELLLLAARPRARAFYMNPGPARAALIGW
eukprot:COSAG03_NODE_2989_length_2304_cov_15.298731_3_plen_33_part_01